MKKTITILCTLFVAISFSQYRQGYEDTMSGAIYFFNDTAKKGSDQPFVKGTPYLTEFYKEAEITGYENVNIPALRYNAFKDEMEFERAGEIYYVPKKIGMVVFLNNLGNKEVYKNLRYLDGNHQNAGFLIEVFNEDGEYSLYKKESVKYVESKDAFTSYVSERPAEFVRNKSEFYLVDNNLLGKKIPSRRKELLNLFPDDQDEILEFIKTNKISISKETDLIELVKYLNTL